MQYQTNILLVDNQELTEIALFACRDDLADLVESQNSAHVKLLIDMLFVVLRVAGLSVDSKLF